MYAKNSLVTDDGLSAPRDPARPLMIVHGLADDNVVVAHSLRLSSPPRSSSTATPEAGPSSRRHSHPRRAGCSSSSSCCC
ncbi:hypothetical protein EAO71_30925 [Streptomyces sp. ms191]|nr:hypothetical protein EAO71_30925 [Streptomyces sp. ms191]